MESTGQNKKTLLSASQADYVPDSSSTEHLPASQQSYWPKGNVFTRNETRTICPDDGDTCTETTRIVMHRDGTFNYTYKNHVHSPSDGENTVITHTAHGTWTVPECLEPGNPEVILTGTVTKEYLDYQYCADDDSFSRVSTANFHQIYTQTDLSPPHFQISSV